MKKVAFITGASRGIGASTALYFAKCGYDVAINYLNSKEQAEKIVSKRVEVLNEMHEKVKNIISEHKVVFDKIVKALEEKHLLSREELLKMIA